MLCFKNFSVVISNPENVNRYYPPEQKALWMFQKKLFEEYKGIDQGPESLGKPRWGEQRQLLAGGDNSVSTRL